VAFYRTQETIMDSLARLERLTALALSALVLTGCASMKVNSYMERGMALGQYHTYGWGPTDTFTTGDPRLDNNPFFQDRVQADVDKALATRGFEKTTSAKPDLLIHYHASVTQQVDVNAADQKYGYCDDCRPYVFDAGTLTIDFVDTRTNRLVWRGWAEDSLDRVVDHQDWLEQKIDEAVTRILERLPQRL
jgi:hypothetical protein